jgi:nicotinamidase-related amidase
MYHPAMKPLLVVATVLSLFSASIRAEPITLHARRQVQSNGTSGEWQPEEKTLQWDSKKTAIVICDMWDKHWCKGATERVAEMAPRMNDMIKAARAKGVFIIHAPSDTMKFYEGTPQRKLAQAAPVAKPPVPLQGWCNLNPDKEAPLPIDDSDGGCDDQPTCKNYKAWTSEIPTLEIAPEDAITDSNEAYNLLQQRGIENVIVMGVHANMCVLGRPFSIRQMVGVGKNVVLVRDMTDTMYNSRSRPFVNHFRGTGLIVQHIERYWCPSITSVDFIGGKPFRFSHDRSK